MLKPVKENFGQGARLYSRALLCLVCAALMAVSPAHADREDREASRRETAQRGGQDSGGAARAAALAQGRYGGKVLKVSPRGGSSYNVRLLLPDGTVKSVTVDAGD